MNELKASSTETTRPGELYTPRFDIWETGDAVIVCGDLPGVAPQDLDIRFEDRELIVHGKVADRPQPAQYLLNEYGVGDFHRSFAIGDAIDSEQIHADLKNGVLTITLPKSSALKTRRVEVKAG